MYDEKKQIWISDCPDERLRIKYCKEAEEGKAEALFMLASVMLSEASFGKQSAEAVYLMEQAAKDEYSPAMYAMGQLFHQGWAVQKNRDTALGWYRKAASCGYEPAVRFLRRRRRRKWAAAWIGMTTAILLSLAILTALKGIGWLSGIIPFFQEKEEIDRGEVKVGEHTELTETISFEEFDQKFRKLVSEYDNELVISGQLATNRLILKFEGKELDLTDFLADHVLARENNMVVIQFSSEEEAERCLEELKKLETIKFVEMDVYQTKTNGSSGDAEEQMNQESLKEAVIRKSTSSGSQYYSWGAEVMGFPRLAEYAAQKFAGNTVKVAVLDTGVEPHVETRNRILEGWDIEGGNGQTDCDLSTGHGTHVAGTILDCTQGTGVEIIPVGVFTWDALSQDTVASSLSVACGLEYAIYAGADVINMSLGGELMSMIQTDTLQAALDADIVVVVSAGNESDDTENYWPACEENCIVVGAIDENGTVALFSNYGSSVDVVAPGTDVISDGTGSERFRILSGTSQAAPHIAAMAALLRMSYPDAKEGQIEKYIKDYSCGFSGMDQDYYGNGLPLGNLFVEE